MSYIENNLLVGEEIIYRGRLHWIVFLWPFFWLVFPIILFNGGGNMTVAGEISILIAIITGTSSFIKYTTSEFGITNIRVIVKIGFIRRNSIDLLLNNIEGIEVNQGILERILGFGSILISGTGGTNEPFRKIADPLEFRRRVQEQIARIQDFQ